MRRGQQTPRTTTGQNKTEKAYKLLAAQEGISNREAKDLIDRGLVYIGKDKVKIARAEISPQSAFSIKKIAAPKKIFEDENLIAVDKPAFLTAEEVMKRYKGATLLHRLDKETSGVMLLTKDEEFRLKAIEEFRHERVHKEYIAWVSGLISEEVVIEKPILTEKGTKAVSRISPHGKPAHTEIEPLEVFGKRTKIKAVITTGRTHQIRVHMRAIEHPVLGDTQYGGVRHARMMLHAHKIKLFDYEFTAPAPSEFTMMH